MTAIDVSDTSVSFLLDWPPSINAMYFTDPRTGRRVLSSTARKYKAKVTTYVVNTLIAHTFRQIRAQVGEPFIAEATYELQRPEGWYTKSGEVHTRKGDTDDLIKAVKDAVWDGLGWDDAHEFRTVIEKKKATELGVRVTLRGLIGELNHDKD